jgi:hypothetical protein
MNPLLRILLGSGQLPPELRAAVTAEETLFLEEGLTGSVTYRDFRIPGHGRGNWRKQAASGSIAVTRQRLVVWAFRYKHIDVPHDHPVRAGIAVTAEQPDRICFAYDAGATDPSRSGKVEVRLGTPNARQIAELLGQQAASF